jgi:hypothetical protein
MKMKKEAKTALAEAASFAFIFAILFIIIFASKTLATTSGSSSEANLTIWDETDLGYIRLSNEQIIFYANYTNKTGEALNVTNGFGNCTIQLNFAGTFTNYENMSFNSSILVWLFNRTFNYKGTHQFRVNCTSTAGNVTLNESFLVTNTAPSIFTTSGGTFIDFDGNTGTPDYWQCNEDTLCTYNFSSNITEPDVNDVLTYSVSSTNTTLTSYVLNATTGILQVNITNDSVNGLKQIRLEVTDSDLGFDSKILSVNLSSLNDAPRFLNLTNQTMNITEVFEYFINVTDEENNVPFTYNITFLNCSVAEWSTRNCSNSTGRELFNSSQYTVNTTAGWINISFTPTRNDVGDYVIMFNVTDLNNNVTPYNATTSMIVNFTVLNVNEIPYFTYICDNERNATENSEFGCHINATDIDETNNLTFEINYTWFKFNNTGINWTQIMTNSTLHFNATAIINFTPTDAEVGNWSVNISLKDTGTPQKTNSTTFYFYIDNINDSVSIADVQNKTAYTSSSSVTISINATDDDLLIPDKRVYNETLTFTPNNTLLTVSGYTISANMTKANITFNPNTLGTGTHNINLTVRDANNYSIASDIFTITISDNNAPLWNETMQTDYALIEDTAFYLNLSKNVTDPDSDTLTFSYTDNTVAGNPTYTFPEFSLNVSTGVINFTPIDADVGYHNLTITVSDGKSSASKEFNFTVSNIVDAPYISQLQDSSTTITRGSSINITEDSATDFYLYIQDDDYRIKQTSFYAEDQTINLTIWGINSTLFAFGAETFLSEHPTKNTSQAHAVFTPHKADVGSYNISINVTDFGGLSAGIFSFNLTVLETNHPPNMTSVGNHVVSILNETLYLDINATDLEDGNETDGNLTYTLTNLTAGGNFLTINSSTGIINFTFNQTHAGLWKYNLSVNDTTGLTDSEIFNVTVYDYPQILLPNSSFTFNFIENSSYELNFTVNHTVQDNLTYTLIINGNTRNSTSGYGNGTAFFWNFTTNCTDETACSGAVNLTLNVSNSKLSNSTSWSLIVNHTNYPLAFLSTIGAQSGGSPVSLTLSNYFSDMDASDRCVNQTVGFTYSLVNNSASGGEITVAITNWSSGQTPSVSFSAASDGSANYTITGIEYTGGTQVSNATSNSFSVELTVSSTTNPPATSTGGGATLKLISLKIIVPEPVSAKQKDRLVIPLGIVNDGTIDLRGIDLGAMIAKDGLLRKDLIASFDVSYFDILRIGKRENVTLIVDIDTSAVGLFEVTINGTVASPEYNDWAKFYIEIEEEKDVLERIIFTEEFIIGNPECAEFMDLLEEAKALFAQGKEDEALKKSEDSLDACKSAISQPPTSRVYERLGDNFFSLAAIASLIALILGFVYYQYKKIKLKRQISGYQENLNNHFGFMR